MAKQDDIKGSTKVRYTTVNTRAQAIETIAKGYPDKEIKAKITPIVDEKQAKRLAAKAIGISDLIVVTAESRAEVEERYVGLAKAGTSSVVELDVPDGARQFGFDTFYEEVDEHIEAQRQAQQSGPEQ